MLDQIKPLADEVFPEVVRLRRALHRRPELAFEEEETARLVAETLRPLGLDLKTGIATTGVVATLEGGEPGPAVMLRADMDALPIQEQNAFDFASEHAGKMHACGHDAHTASLLGTALILHRLKEQLPGTVHFLFQPSEEKIPGGAKVMIEEGALQDGVAHPVPEAIFGQHVWPALPVGTLGVRGGPFLASADEVYVTVRGEGGHAAAPHLLRTDAVVAAAHVVVALQSVMSRHRPPEATGTLSLGRMIGDGATNVLPESVQIEGTFRAMDEDWRFRAHELIRRAAEATARAHGAEAEVEIKVGYPALVNDEGEAALVREAAAEFVGAEQVVEMDMWFGAEDFAHYLQQMPGAFYVLGVRNEAEGIVHGLHTPRFTIDEEALRVGPGFMAYLAWRRLAA